MLFAGLRGSTLKVSLLAGLVAVAIGVPVGCDNDPGDGPSGTGGRGGQGGRSGAGGPGAGGGAGGPATGGAVGPGGSTGGGTAGSVVVGSAGNGGRASGGNAMGGSTTGGAAGMNPGGRSEMGGGPGGRGATGGAVTPGTGGGAGGRGGGGGRGGSAGGRGGSAGLTGAAGAGGSPCASGYHDCAGTCQKNDDAQHCGATCVVCGAPPNTVPATCNGTQCIYACQTGFDACDGNKGDANGCEINLTTDASHCGSCPIACSDKPNATASCVAGMCGIVCNAGYGNCNSNITDGCEINLKNNVVHCGRCNTTHPGATASDLQQQETYDPNAGPPSCRLWLGEQCTATSDTRVAICCDPTGGAACP